MTVAANVADDKTGGIYLSGGHALINNSVISGNTGPNAIGVDFYSTGPGAGAINFSVLGSAPLGSYVTSGGLVRTNDPMLGTLTDNGGSTPTMLPQPGSPTIDAGDNSLATDTSNNLLEYDQRGVGFPRINHSIVDIGAAEFEDAIFADGFQ